MRTLKSARLVAVLVLFAILASALTAKASLPTTADVRPSLSLQTRLFSASRVPLPRSVSVALAKSLFAQGLSRAVLVSDENGNLIYFGDMEAYSDRTKGPLNPCCNGEAQLQYIEIPATLRHTIQRVVLERGLTDGAFTLNANGELVQIGNRSELEQYKQEALKKYFDPKDDPQGAPGRVKMNTLNSLRTFAVLVLFAILASAFSANASLPSAGGDVRPSLTLQTRLLSASRVPFSRSVAIALTQSLYMQGLTRAVLVSDDNGNLIYFGDIEQYADRPPGNPCCQGDGVVSLEEKYSPEDKPCCTGEGDEPYIEVSEDLRRAIQKTLVYRGLNDGVFTLNANGELVQIGKRHEFERLKQEAGLGKALKSIIKKGPRPPGAPQGPPGEG